MIQDSVKIGWREWFSLPQLGIPAIKVKVDTGARTSCLHTFSYEEFERDGKLWISFLLHPLQKKEIPEIRCEAPLVDWRIVTDSGGHKESRPVIKTQLVAGYFQKDNLQGQVSKDIEITLTNRESMLFRMLLGRTAMVGKFTVHPSCSYVLGEPTLSLLQQFYPHT